MQACVYIFLYLVQLYTFEYIYPLVTSLFLFIAYSCQYVYTYIYIIYTCRSIYLSTYLPIFLHFCLSYLWFFSGPFVYRVFAFPVLSWHLSICLSTYLSFFLSNQSNRSYLSYFISLICLIYPVGGKTLPAVVSVLKKCRFRHSETGLFQNKWLNFLGIFIELLINPCNLQEIWFAKLARCFPPFT